MYGVKQSRAIRAAFASIRKTAKFNRTAIVIRRASGQRICDRDKDRKDCKLQFFLSFHC